MEYGQGYEIWASFINEYGTYSEPGELINLIFASNSKNNPPYFTLDPDSTFIFVVGQNSEYELMANDADGNDLSFEIVNDSLGITLDGDIVSWTPNEEQKGVYSILITVSDGSETDTTHQNLIVYTQSQVDINLAFSSVNLYEDDNMFVKISNYFCTEFYQQATLRNTRTNEEIPVECRKVNDFEFIGQFALSFINRSEIQVANGDTIELNYSDGKEDYFAYAYYDSLAQPSDQNPPGKISDLQLEQLANNQLKLKWTATGNNNTEGSAYKYDIRYAYESIGGEDIYYTAFLIEEYPYPSVADEMDSLIVDLTSLIDIENHDTVYFSIKAEDEMQNRGELSNSPGEQCFMSPQNLQAKVSNVYMVNVNWEGPANGKSTFEHFKLYRKFKQGLFYEIATGLENADFDDNLKDSPDGEYQYAVQSIYESGASDTVFSETITLDRFQDVSILCSLEDSTNYQGINISLQGLDSVYIQSFTYTTNITGLVLLADVYKTEYAISISLDGFDEINDTIEISDQQFIFEYKLLHSLRHLNIDIPKGWSGLSISVVTENDSIEVLTKTIIDDLIILQNDNGMYWPGQNVNTLGNWNMESGYKIKVAEDVNLTVSGSRLENQSLDMTQSWNLMPVLSECPTDVAELFATADVEIVKEVAGWRVYWPEFGINTLEVLEPGKAYFALMDDAGEIEFPECDGLKSVSIGTLTGFKTLSELSPWQLSKPTAISHNIAFPISVNNAGVLNPGDILGVFDGTDNCFGIMEWNGSNTAITVFGNDPMTAEKDGFDPGENMVFKLYCPENGSEKMLEVEFNYAMPQQEAFAENGLSAISKIKSGSTSITNPGQVQQSQIVPNPAHDAFTLILDFEPQSLGTLELYNLKGQLMKTVQIKAKSTKVKIEDLPGGVYIAHIQIDNQTIIKRIIKD